jgi:hypothetical protein
LYHAQLSNRNSITGVRRYCRHRRPVPYRLQAKALRQPGGIGKDDFVAIEIHELDKKNPYPAGELIPSSKHLPPPFDFERLTRFMSYGFIMAPVSSTGSPFV